MLKNKTVLITGARGGIGRSIAKAFAQVGTNLILHSRNESAEFSEFCHCLENEYHVTVSQIYFDMTEYSAMKTVLREIVADKTPLDVLVNNAGVPHVGLFQMTSMQTIREVFEINLFAQMELTQFLLRKMVKQGKGVIVNLSSCFGLDLSTGGCAYGISKAAIAAFTKTLAAEVGPMGIRVNAVAPGLIDAGMADAMGPKSRDRMIRDCAMGRLGTPEEVAKSVVFLSSDASSYINGQILRIDGGHA